MARMRILEETARLTFSAGGTINKGRFVKASGSSVVQCDTAGERAIGVALTDASSGETLSVAVDGVVSVEAGGSVNLGVEVTTDTQGRVIAVSDPSSQKTLGVSLEAASGAGDFILVKLL